MANDIRGTSLSAIDIATPAVIASGPFMSLIDHPLAWYGTLVAMIYGLIMIYILIRDKIYQPWKKRKRIKSDICQQCSNRGKKTQEATIAELVEIAEEIIKNE